MNPLKCSYLAFLVLLCLGFSFGHRILHDTKNNDPQAKNQSHENKAMEETHGVGYGYGTGSNGGTGIGIGYGGGDSNDKCQGAPCQQPQQPCQGQGGVYVPGIQIPGVEIPPISIPLPVPQFPVPTQPSPCQPQNCNPGPCPPENMESRMTEKPNELKKNDDGDQHELEKNDVKTHEDEAKKTNSDMDVTVESRQCPPYRCQPYDQENNVTGKPNELKKNGDDDQNEMGKNDVKNHEDEAKRKNLDMDGTVEARTLFMKTDEEARQVHH